MSRITIEALQSAVAERFGMDVATLTQKKHSRAIVAPRQIAMYLARQLTNASLPEIGRRFGGKHHTTVMYSINKVTRQSRHDKTILATLGQVQGSLIHRESAACQRDS
jgi:chromosomal replication initiator protein